MYPAPVRVLLVDDSAVARLTVSRQLRAEGVDVVEAPSCAAAKALDVSAVDCALLDYDLGDGFGPEVAAHLRAVRSSLPLAFFSSEAPDAIAAKTAPFGPLFAKPAETDRAIAWILSHRPG